MHGQDIPAHTRARTNHDGLSDVADVVAVACGCHGSEPARVNEWDREVAGRTPVLLRATHDEDKQLQAEQRPVSSHAKPCCRFAACRISNPAQEAIQPRKPPDSAHSGISQRWVRILVGWMTQQGGHVGEA